MSRRWSLLLAGLLLAATACAQETGYPPLKQEELYLRAMRALDEGRPDEASGLLNRFLEEEPQHAGAWLDLAISQCELGHADEAERLFMQVEQRFAPTQAILDVMASYRVRGCTGIPLRRDLLSLTLARGYDSNVNQGANSRFFAVGPGEQPDLWELDPEFLPKADQYSLLSLDYTRAFDNKGTLAFAQLRARRHDQVSEQDTAALTVGVERPWQMGNWRVRASALLGITQLDRQLYQRQGQVQARVTPPQPLLPEWLSWSVLAGLSRVNYPTRSSYDGNTYELSSMLNYRGSAFQGMVSAGVLRDRGSSDRLGGNRDGTFSSALLYGRLGDKVNGELGWSRQVWRGSTVYSPSLIDLVRRQDTQQLRATLSYQLAPQHSVLLEARAVRNSENIGLFAYNGRILQLSWRWDAF